MNENMQAFKRKNSPDNDPVWGHILNGKMVDDRDDIQIFGDNESIESILDKHAFFVSSQLDEYELVKLKFHSCEINLFVKFMAPS